MAKKERNVCLNIIEGIATYCVVMIHCRFPGRVGEEIAQLSWFAVPLFFAVSGYFYYNVDVKKSLSNTRRKVLHLIPMIILTELFYALWAFALGIRKYGVESGIINSIRIVMNAQISAYDPWAITVGFPVFEGQCWFIVQLIIAYVVFHLFLKFNLKNLLYELTPAALIAGSLLSLAIYQKHGFYPAWYMDKWAFFCSIPYFTIGYWMHENEKTVKDIRISNGLLILMGIVLVKIELEVWLDIGLSIGHAFITFALLRLSMQNQGKHFDCFLMKALNTVGEKYTLFIYLFHTWVYATFDTIFASIAPTIVSNMMWGWIRPFVACILSTVFAIMCFYVLNLIRFPLRMKNRSKN